MSSNYTKPAFVDIDGDGDFDIVTAEFTGDFYYYENTGTVSAPTFGAAQINPFSLTETPDFKPSSFFVDLDSDGDFDMLASDYYGDFYYYENTGTATAISSSSDTVLSLSISATA